MTDPDQTARNHHCPHCGNPLAPEQDIGELCDHCLYIRALEDERTRLHKRAHP